MYWVSFSLFNKLKILINRLGNYIFVTNDSTSLLFNHLCVLDNSQQSKYAFVHLEGHNLKSVYPTIVKVYIFRKFFPQGFQKWHYFYSRGKSENMIANQNVKFDKKCF